MTTVVDAVLQLTTDARVRLSMLVGAALEGGTLGSGPFPIGDNGTSYGPYQFHFADANGDPIPSKFGLTPAQANDPTLAARAIESAYKYGVSKVDPALWSSDPGQAAAQAAYYAEQPASMYPAARVSAAYGAVKAALGGTLPDTGAGGATGQQGSGTTDVGLPNPFGGASDALGALGSALSTLTSAQTWWRVLFVLAGLGLIVIGVGILNRRTIGDVGARGASLAAVAGE